MSSEYNYVQCFSGSWLRPFQILLTFNVFADYGRAKIPTLYERITPFAGLQGSSKSILENLTWTLQRPCTWYYIIVNITKPLQILYQLSKFLIGKIICDDPAATM